VWQLRVFRTLIPVTIAFMLLLLVSLSLKSLEHQRIIESLNNKGELFTSAIFTKMSENVTEIHKLQKNQLVHAIDDFLVKNTDQVCIENAIQDIHFVITSLDENAERKIFESSNKSKKSKKWRSIRSFKFSQHKWRIEAFTTAEYFINNASWLMWWMISIGFLFIAFLGAGLLVITGNAILINDKVRDRTKEINTLNKIHLDSENRYKQIIEIQPVIFWKHILGEKQLDFVSDEAVNILGYSKRELMDLGMVLNKLIHPDDREKVQENYVKGAKSLKRYVLKYRAMSKDGRLIWLKDYATPQKVKNRIEIIGLKIDITKDQEKEIKIAQLAYYDTMTKLPNRDKFMLYLDKEIKQSEKNNTFGAVLYLDLDRFKILNDSMGHYFGDQLLIQIAQRLNKSLKSSDICSRFGGDEFVILIRNQSPTLQSIRKKALHVAQKVQQLIKEPFDIDGHNFYTSFSTGISLFPSDSNRANEVIQQADIAMYQSKSKGKNTISFFKKEMQELANLRLNLEKSLKIALLKHQFEMYYQPIFNQDKETVRLEALIRWNSPDEGILTPSSFIHIAEETGFIIELSEWIIDDVFENLVRWQQSELNVVPVSINISLFQFKNTNIIEILEEKIHKFAIDTGLITLELTETIGIDDFDDALSKLHQLKKLGFQIAIDDFGSGYSSLNYLIQMPIDILKLDKSFTANIGKDSNSEILIETIMLMANKLNLDVIVEGIETNEQLDFLIGLGCQTFQGHLLSEAVPFTQLKSTS
jgi:diguanylate cyclase (GGDEF)-like protein/PAS domain S-box-containing protein